MSEDENTRASRTYRSEAAADRGIEATGEILGSVLRGASSEPADGGKVKVTYEINRRERS